MSRAQENDFSPLRPAYPLPIVLEDLASSEVPGLAHTLFHRVPKAIGQIAYAATVTNGSSNLPRTENHIPYRVYSGSQVKFKRMSTELRERYEPDGSITRSISDRVEFIDLDSAGSAFGTLEATQQSTDRYIGKNFDCQTVPERISAYFYRPTEDWPDAILFVDNDADSFDPAYGMRAFRSGFSNDDSYLFALDAEAEGRIKSYTEINKKHASLMREMIDCIAVAQAVTIQYMTPAVQDIAEAKHYYRNNRYYRTHDPRALHGVKPMSKLKAQLISQHTVRRILRNVDEVLD